MSEIFIISDTHFGHSNILKFLGEDYTPFRKFNDVTEMDEHMIERWNSVVGNNDTVYHLGDVYFGQGHLVLHRLKGKKRLILGNHDNPKSEHLLKHFDKMLTWRKFPDLDCVLSHFPLHESSFFGKDVVNLHGHIHNNPCPTRKHYNCSVEVQDYTPRTLDSILLEIKRSK